MYQIRDITKSFYSKKGFRTDALQGVSLTIADKGFLAIIGKSGSGKTTLLRILGGLERPDGGQIFFQNRLMNKWKEKEYDQFRKDRVGYVFQEFNLIEEWTVRENLAFIYELEGQRFDLEACLAMFKELQIDEEVLTKFPSELSGGQKQRIAIMRALLKHPQVLLLDEPTGALDQETGHGVMKLLKELAQTYLVIVVTHEQEYADLYADRTIEMMDGEIISDSHPLAEDELDYQTPLEKKSRMKAKTYFRLGFRNLRFRKKRLLLSLILVTSVFSVLGTMLPTVFYRADHLAVNTIHREMAKEIYAAAPYGAIATTGSSSSFTDEEEQMLKDNFSTGLYHTYEFSEGADKYIRIDLIPSMATLPKVEGEYDGFYEVGKTPASFFEASEDLLRDMDWSLKEGVLPQKPQEIAITTYHLHLLQKYFGYQNLEDIQKNNYEVVERCYVENIGGTPAVDTVKKVNIVGIIEINYQRSIIFQTLIKERGLESLDFEYLSEQNLESYMPVAAQDYKNTVQTFGNFVLATHEYLEALRARFNWCYSTHEFESSIVSNNDSIHHIKHISLDFPTDAIAIRKYWFYWLDEKSRTELSDNEIIIDGSVLADLWQKYENVDFSASPLHGSLQEDSTSYLGFMFNYVLNNYAAAFYEEHEFDLFADADNINSAYDYAEYIVHRTSNSYDNDHTYEFFVNEVWSNFITSHIDEIGGLYQFTDYDAGDLEVVGVAVDMVRTSNFAQTLFMSEEQAGILYEAIEPMEYRILYFRWTGDFERDLWLVQHAHNPVWNTYRDTAEYYIDDIPDILGSIMNRLEFWEEYRFILIGILTCLTIFASVLLYYYMKISCDQQGRKILILRSLGVSRSQITSSYALEAIGLSLLVIIPTILISFGACGVIQHFWDLYYFPLLSVALFAFQPIHAFILIGGGIVIFNLATLLPLYRFHRQKSLKIKE